MHRPLSRQKFEGTRPRRRRELEGGLRRPSEIVPDRLREVGVSYRDDLDTSIGCPRRPSNRPDQEADDCLRKGATSWNICWRSTGWIPRLAPWLAFCRHCPPKWNKRPGTGRGAPAERF